MNNTNTIHIIDKHKIYIAGPFSTHEERQSLEHMIELVKQHYKGREYDIYVPMYFKVPGDYQMDDGSWNLPNNEWAKTVYEEDIKYLDEATIIYVMNIGMYKTAGTVWEIGYAKAKDIPVVAYVPEWAKNNDMSLMIMNSIVGYLDEDANLNTITSDYLKQFNQK